MKMLFASLPATLKDDSSVAVIHQYTEMMSKDGPFKYPTLVKDPCDIMRAIDAISTLQQIVSAGIYAMHNARETEFLEIFYGKNNMEYAISAWGAEYGIHLSSVDMSWSLPLSYLEQMLGSLLENFEDHEDLATVELEVEFAWITDVMVKLALIKNLERSRFAYTLSDVSWL